LGALVGDGVALMALLVAVHVTAGYVFSRAAALALPILPIVVAVTTGSDLVDPWGFLILVYCGSATLIALGLLARRLASWVRHSEGSA